MTEWMLRGAMGFALVCVVLSMVFCTVRLLLGPSSQDRILALDTLWMTAMLLALVIGMRTARTVYFDIAMLIALTGFVSTIAVAKFLLRGEVIE
ncbi:K+/H+ antiporter subunit F [Ramlibacter sp. AW1]|uniref:K+/H+ antiporter subunit F n=1 Tax=Ramlibacter aurantiacus TaxID=2801330 RepID=A0A937D675_9BURK|nr:K+/H+ antiporter subunit F [Ramlibacter aurantiacus]MBL0420668.1 K+/H+ antiporter subunit F [Ramlibacter aurantiacus]